MKFKKGVLVTRTKSEFKPEYWRVEETGRVTIKAKNINTHKVHVFHVADVRLVPEKKKNAEVGLNNLTDVARKLAKAITLKNGPPSDARNEKSGGVRVFAYVRRILRKIRVCVGFLLPKWLEKRTPPFFVQENPGNRPILESFTHCQEGRVKKWNSR